MGRFTTKGKIPVWQMVREAATAINKDVMDFSEIKQYIRNKYENVNEFTIECQIKACCVNFSGRTNWAMNKRQRVSNGQYDFLYFLEAQRITLYDSNRHGHWEIISYNSKFDVRQTEEVTGKDNLVSPLSFNAIPINDPIETEKKNPTYFRDIHSSMDCFEVKKALIMGKYVFIETPFEVYEKNIPSPFLDYRGRKVIDLLQKNNYFSLTKTINKEYSQFLNADISELMTYLIRNNDNLFLCFLNKNGNDTFCRFSLSDESIYNQRGLYLYTYKDEIVYIGRCRDSYLKRFGNSNYGNIDPINCYKHGQSTNTHMNSLINRFGDDIKIYLCALSDVNEIEESERILRQRLRPVWNRQI
jgi:hypothetical protein